MNGIVNQARERRSRTLPSDFIKRTAVAPLPQTKGQLGAGEVSLYITESGEFAPEVSTWSFAEPEAPAEVPTETPMEEFAAWMSGQQSATAGGVVLKRGDRGDQVRTLQTQLRRLGFGYSKVDGIYGALTEQAVYQFQQSMGLSASGVVDEVTWAALLSAVPPLPSSGIPSTAAVALPSVPAPIEREIRTVVAPTTTAVPALPTAGPGAPAETKVILGIPTGFWVAIGAIVLTLFATAAPGLTPSPRPQPHAVLRA